MRNNNHPKMPKQLSSHLREYTNGCEDRRKRILHKLSILYTCILEHDPKVFKLLNLKERQLELKESDLVTQLSVTLDSYSESDPNESTEKVVRFINECVQLVRSIETHVEQDDLERLSEKIVRYLTWVKLRKLDNVTLDKYNELCSRSTEQLALLVLELG